MIFWGIGDLLSMLLSITVFWQWLGILISDFLCFIASILYCLLCRTISDSIVGRLSVIPWLVILTRSFTLVWGYDASLPSLCPLGLITSYDGVDSCSKIFLKNKSFGRLFLNWYSDQIFHWLFWKWCFLIVPLDYSSHTAVLILVPSFFWGVPKVFICTKDTIFPLNLDF